MKDGSSVRWRTNGVRIRTVGDYIFAGFHFLGICEMHSDRFGSPYAKVLPKNHFTLKKMGASDAMEPTLETSTEN
jgi:hypothetical protein